MTSALCSEGAARYLRISEMMSCTCSARSLQVPGRPVSSLAACLAAMLRRTLNLQILKNFLPDNGRNSPVIYKTIAHVTLLYFIRQVVCSCKCVLYTSLECTWKAQG